MALVGQGKLNRKELGSKRWKQVRLRILQRDNYICYYCGADNATTVDHIIARKHGGDMFDESNLVTSCKRCNSSKGAKPVFLGTKATPPVFSRHPSPVTTSEVHHSPFETDLN